MQAHNTPKLNTEVTAPLHALERHLLTREQMIRQWLDAAWQKTMPPIYGSVDLRNAGYKLAPIDMNLFPAGFNNLNPNFLSVAVTAAKKILERKAPLAKKILIIPEAHTRNPFYWQNIQTLQEILTQAGYEVQAETLDALTREQNKLSAKGFQPDVILLNNDLSEGIPELLLNLQQPLLPPAALGWSQRLKSEHFQYYAKVVDEFAAHVGIDPWLIAPLFRHCGKIDFMQQEGMDCLVTHGEALFAEINKKYAEYHIPFQPFLIVKANAGTYGMAVMTVRDPKELTSLNRKQRTRMSTTKGGQPVHQVIIQEGVYTFETLGPDQAVAEPVVYLLGETVVGGFYRVHKDRGIDENLNTPGMQFEPIAFSQSCNDPRADMDPDVCQNRFYLYGLVAQLSMLAAGREIQDQEMLQ